MHQIIDVDSEEVFRVLIRSDYVFIDICPPGSSTSQTVLQLRGDVEIYDTNGQQLYPAPIPMMPKLTAEEEEMIKSEMMRPGIIEWLPKNSITPVQRETFRAKLYDWIAQGASRWPDRIDKLVDELLLIVSKSEANK